ncbi:MAG: serine protein kinase RIO [DPANN group archaeon]|nr:serine protein kinase RIO [DPANN group archaeon]
MSEKEIHRGREFFKIRERVFDNYTNNALLKVFGKNQIASLDFPISTGKEADVFRATAADGTYRAVKIFRIETTGFHHMTDYIEGDPRFEKIRGTKRGIVKVWCQKEFRNLIEATHAKVRVPHAFGFFNNVLLMEFIDTDDGNAAPLLKYTKPEKPADVVQFLIDSVIALWKKAKLVHADLNDFNVLMNNNEPVIIDIGQGVSIEHPMSREFLERDLREIEKIAKKYKVPFDHAKVIKQVLE